MLVFGACVGIFAKTEFFLVVASKNTTLEIIKFCWLLFKEMSFVIFPFYVVRQTPKTANTTICYKMEILNLLKELLLCFALWDCVF